MPLLLPHRLFGTACRRTYGHPHRCSCSDVGSSLSFFGVLWAQDTLRDFYLLAVTWPCSFLTLRHVNRNSFIIIIIIIIMCITDAWRPLFRLPCSDAVKLTESSVVADQLEADTDTSQSTLSVYGHLDSSAFIWRCVEVFVIRQTTAVHRCMKTNRVNLIKCMYSF